MSEAVNDMDFVDLCETFFQMERDLDLLDRQIAGVYFWERIRFSVHKQLAGALGIGSEPDNGSETYSAYLNGVQCLLRNIFSRNPYLSSEAELLFYGKGRRKLLEDEYWWDIYIDPLLEGIESTTVCLERPYEVSHARPAKTDQLRYTDLIQYTGTLLQELGVSEVSLSSAETALLERIEREIHDRFDVKVPLQRLVRSDISRRRVRLPLYKRLVRRIDPQIAFLTAAYNGRETFVEACQAEGVPVVELQHGVVTKYHMGYSFPNEDKHVFPEYFFSFGEYWSDAVDLPLPEENVFPVGYPYLEKRKSAFDAADRTDRLVVISQPHSGSRLSAFAAAVNDAGIHEDGVVYKLHPKEYGEWESRYPRLVDSGVKVSEGEPSLYELLATSTVQAGVNSTALYEGLCFGLDTYVLDEPGWRYMEYLVENDHATLLSATEDYFEGRGRGDEVTSDLDSFFFFAQDPTTNFREAVETIAHRRDRDSPL